MTGNNPAVASGNKRLLIVGATSSLAQILCRECAARGYDLVLAGRDAKELEMLAGDLATRFSLPCRMVIADFLDAGFSPAAMMEQAGDFDSVIIATGDLGSGDNADVYNIAYTIHINYTLPAQIATLAARHLSEKRIPPPVGGRLGWGQSCSTADSLTPEQASPHRNLPPKGEGTIVIISSIAGDRGRQGNYAYGSAKAALTAFASGLRNAFYKKGVHVMTVKPGFIDTPMTWGMESKLIASREYVAKKIIAAMERKKDVMYVPWFWRWIMLVIRHIPERVFKRMSL